MKTNLKTFAIAVLAIAAPFFASATTPNSSASLKASMYVAKDGNVKVFLENQYAKPATIVVKDVNEKVLFEKKAGASKNLIGLKFDVNGLPDGDYTVQISNGKDTFTQVLKLSTPTQKRGFIPAS